jgi:hypothetical protein
MAITAPERHPALYLLGDHLDAALAMGEDLLTERLPLAEFGELATIQDLMRQNREIADFLRSVRTLELTMISRVLQARKLADELKRRESQLKPFISLFASGTSALLDAAAELGDPTNYDFDTGDEALAFLRSRGLIALDTPSLGRLSQLAVTEDYQVAGRVRLGTLLDLVATFLDTLDTVFELYRRRQRGDAVASLSADAPLPFGTGR